jgi:Nif-specific regulatory protein
MESSSPKRLDLGTWLADLKRIGGQARTLADRGSVTETVMNLGDLQMLEEAAKRIIVSLSSKAMYALPVARGNAGRNTSDAPVPGGGNGEIPLSLSGASSAATGYAPQRTTVHAAVGARRRPHSHGIIGSTEAMRQVHHLIDKASACSLPVLIQGESGTGKELVARAVHERSNRRHRRFFSENCSALSESLLESELFGHVRGAFTGADRDRKGILELADGGTLFLDEIGDMSLRMQSKLLRALQEREFRPVGGKEMVRIDVRIISATNRNLRALINEGHFREDLLYRINVVTIALPLLQDRRDDIPLLTAHFLEQIAKDTGLPRKEFSEGALALLVGYGWPGNIRELENVVQRAVALSENLRIEASDLPDRIRHVMITEEPPRYTSVGKGGEQLMIEKALHNFEGDKTRASRFIGWSRPKLYRRMRVYGIPIDFGRPGARR